jgi:hypothetical protein
MSSELRVASFIGLKENTRMKGTQTREIKLKKIKQNLVLRSRRLPFFFLGAVLLSVDNQPASLQ